MLTWFLPARSQKEFIFLLASIYVVLPNTKSRCWYALMMFIVLILVKF